VRLCDDVNVEEVGGLRGGRDCGYCEDFRRVGGF